MRHYSPEQAAVWSQNSCPLNLVLGLMTHSYDQRYIGKDQSKSFGKHQSVSGVVLDSCGGSTTTMGGKRDLHHDADDDVDLDSRHEEVSREKHPRYHANGSQKSLFTTSQPLSHRTPPPITTTTTTGCSKKKKMLVVVGPPRIHRITSSPARPSLLYERIGDASLGIFKMRLPESMVGRLDAIIAHAEEYMTTTRNGSWKTGLYSLTRQDVAMRQIPDMKARIDPIVDYLTRTMEALYGCRRVLMDRNQPHILKYSIDSGHTGVQLHHDRCDITANLVLSKSDEYEGGGTFFPEVDGRVIRLEQGDFLLHPGSLLHGGMDIEQGTRFLMILFAHLRFD